MDMKMKSENYIRIKKQDMSVYRIMPVKRVMEMIESRCLVLVRPSMWDDPFENFFLSQHAIDPKSGNKISLQPLADSWYGQCWSSVRETDALWRIYSHDKRGIRIKSTLNKLAQALWIPGDEHSSAKFFVGAVEYMSQKKIQEYLQSVTFTDLAFGGDNMPFARSLLIKRNEFKHEKEIRLLAHTSKGDNDSRSAGELYKIDIDPESLIEEICFDPRVSDKCCKCLVERFRRAGYGGKVRKSGLYSFKPISIKMQ